VLSQKLTEQPSLNKKGARRWQKENRGCRANGN
jgi:post-segregation antitoxin (ccd killing protein)